MPEFACPACGNVMQASRILERHNGVPTGEYDRAYCSTCSRIFSRDADTGEVFALSKRPICHICWGDLVLDVPRSTESIHVYACREHVKERCSYVVETGVWIWHSTSTRPTPTTI